MRLSTEQKKWQTSNCCPHCGKFLFATREFVDGHERTGIHFSVPKDESAVSECMRCGHRWPIYEREGSIEVLEGGRESVFAYSEEFTLDNSNGRSPLRRTKSISQVWQHIVEIGMDQTQAREEGLKFGPKALSVTTVARNTLSSTYKITSSETKTFTDTLDFDVPPNTARKVVLTYNRVWQIGVIKLTTHEDGPQIVVPYRLVIGLAFDVAQHDT